MPLGTSATTATAYASAFVGGTAFQLGAHWIQMHSGDPGPNGTANVTNGGDRVLATFAAPSNEGSYIEVLNDVELTYTDWSGASPVTHVSSWSAESGGTFQQSGQASFDAPTPGGTLTVAIGSIAFRFPVASA